MNMGMINRDAAILVGRTLMVALFLSGGFLKIKYLAGTAAYMEEVGIPGAGEPMALACGMIELVGALAILVGYRTRAALVMLVAYMVPVTWYTHLAIAQNAVEPVVRDNELFQTLKNISVIGGLCLLYVTGPGSHSLAGRK